MIKKCMVCGVEKDTAILETYPYPEDERLCEEPIEPLLVLECEGVGGFGSDNPWKACVVCHQCFKNLDPDMWISENCWKSLNPVVKYEELPEVKEDGDTMWNVENY